MQSATSMTESRSSEARRMSSDSGGAPMWAHPNSAWQRMKDVLRRDWERTKADFVEKTGPNVASNENDETPPKPDAFFSPDEIIAGFDESFAEATNARLEAPHRDGDAGETQVDKERRHWFQVAREASFGFGARTQYPQFSEWNTELERTLRLSWRLLGNEVPWEDARPGVRRGWDFYVPHKH